MDKKIRLDVTILLIVLVGLALGAGCASSPQTEPATDATATATPDPLYSVNCPRQTKNTYLCYAGEKLLDDNALLEKAASDFCLPKVGRCSLFIWKDEASVGQTYPLTDAETQVLLAQYTWNMVTFDGCFKAFQDGETVFTSGNCTQ